MVNDVRRCTATNNYGCGYGDVLTGMVSAAVMVPMCVIAMIPDLVPDADILFYLLEVLQFSCLSCVGCFLGIFCS